jgi:hypothetical protein
MAERNARPYALFITDLPWSRLLARTSPRFFSTSNGACTGQGEIYIGGGQCAEGKPQGVLSAMNPATPQDSVPGENRSLWSAALATARATTRRSRLTVATHSLEAANLGGPAYHLATFRQALRRRPPESLPASR